MTELGGTTELRDDTSVDRTAANGRRSGQGTEQARNPVAGAAEGMRAAQTATVNALTTLDAFKQWSDRLAGTPITLLSGDAWAALSGRAWVDGAFEVTGTLVAAQRQYLDQLLANQHQLVGNLLDSNFALTKAMWQATSRLAENDRN